MGWRGQDERELAAMREHRRLPLRQRRIALLTVTVIAVAATFIARR